MKNAKTVFGRLVVAVVLVAVALAALVGRVQAKPLRVFVIGNSFSMNATRYLPQLAAEGGHELVLGKAERGGCSLKMHWDALEAAEANPNDPKARVYPGKKTLPELLAADTWDIVTLQQVSILSSDIETYRPYARKLYDYIKQKQPQAEIVFHQTWAYRSDSKDFGRIGDKKSASSSQEMWEASHAAYQTVAAELGTRLIPTGDAFQNVAVSPDWQYKADTTFNFDTATPPALPDQKNSLNAGYSWKTDKTGRKMLSFDSHHANAAGCYLGGLVWYGFLFGESPEKLTFKPDPVAPDFAAFLRQTAWQTLQKTAKANAPATQ